MSFSEVGKAAMDVVKETQGKAKELLKNIDSRIDVKNTLTDNLTKNDNKDKINDVDSRIDFNKMQERMNDTKIGGKSDVDGRIDVNTINEKIKEPIISEQNDVDSKNENNEVGQQDDDYKKKLDQTPRDNWEGKRGESKFICDECKPFGLDGIEYKNAEPNFDTVSIGKCEIDNMTSQRYSSIDAETGERNKGNYEKYDEVMGKELEDKGFKKVDGNWVGPDGTKYTRHERCDGKTMELVPTEIHKKCTHSGGVSACKVMENQGGKFDG